MLKRLSLAFLLSSLSTLSFANPVAGISYLYFYDDDLNLDISGLGASLGYRLKVNNEFSLLPEIRLGAGISKDRYTVQEVNIDREVDYFAAFALRTNYEINNELQLFATLSYAYLETTDKTTSGPFRQTSNDEWEFGYGAGLGIRFSPSISVDIMYEQYDDTGLGSLNLKYDF